MTRKFRWIALLATGSIIALAVVGIKLNRNFKSALAFDGDPIVVDKYPSPDGQRSIVVFQYDHGAVGYSRVFWAIAPSNLTKIDFEDFLLPDGYQACGWTRSGEVVVIPWTPYYYSRQPETTLHSGQIFKSVKIKIVPNPELNNQGAYSLVHQSL